MMHQQHKADAAVSAPLGKWDFQKQSLLSRGNVNIRKNLDGLQVNFLT